MRWDRLFDDLEAQADDLEREERDALVDELVDGEWADTRWRQPLGGRATLEIVGGIRVEGDVVLANERLVQIAGDRSDHVVAASSVMVVRSAGRRPEEVGRVASALGWGQVFRALRDAGDEVVVRLVDGSTREGLVAVVGGDFVRLVSASGLAQDVLWTAIVMVSGRT